MPVVVVATITPLPGRADAVRAALLEAVPRVHSEDGCDLYALHEGRDGFVMIEQWRSQEALDVHSRAPALAALGPGLAGNVAGPAVVTLLTALPAGDPTKGQVVP